MQPEKLKARRKELKLTQKEIAEQLGISFQAYSSLGTWNQGTVQGEGVPARKHFKSRKRLLHSD